MIFRLFIFLYVNYQHNLILLQHINFQQEVTHCVNKSELLGNFNDLCKFHQAEIEVNVFPTCFRFTISSTFSVYGPVSLTSYYYETISK